MSKIEFDSDEEMYMYWWFEELKNLGYIKDILHQPEPFLLSEPLVCEYHKQLKTKGKYVEEELMKGHIYTPDYFIIWNDEKEDLHKVTTAIDSHLRKKQGQSINTILCQYEGAFEYVYSYIEVKPSFDRNNMIRLAKINQKWVFDKLGQYVNIVVPEKHFNKTFTPNRFLTTNKSGKVRSIKYKNVIGSCEFLGLGQQPEHQTKLNL